MTIGVPERPAGLLGGGPDFRPGRLLADRDVAGAGIDNDIDGVDQADEQARQDAGGEERDYRLLRRHGVKDHRDRRRDDHRDGAGRRDEADGEAVVVAAAAQRRVDQAADRRDRADGGMRHRSEQFRRRDRRDRQRAARASGQRRDPDDDPLGDAALPHDLAGENEEGNGEERKVVEASEHVGLDRRERYVCHEHDGDQRGKQQNEINREAGAEQNHRQNEIDEDRKHDRALKVLGGKNLRSFCSQDAARIPPTGTDGVWALVSRPGGRRPVSR